MNFARALCTSLAGLLLPLASASLAQDAKPPVPAPAPQLAPDSTEPLPKVAELLARAHRDAAARKEKGEVLRFDGTFEMRSGPLVSSKGRARVYGPRDFRYECDLPNGPLVVRYCFESDAERVLWRLQQLDVKGKDEALVGQGFRAEAWKDAAADAKVALMGLLFLFAAEPAQLLEVAAQRWADLKVVGAGREEDGAEVWRLEAALPPHEVPETYRHLELARVRLHLGRADLVLRRHELLHANGEIYKANRFHSLRLAAPEGDRPARLEVPPGFEIGPLLNPEERAKR
ncbi:MAG: hypothetical protein JNM84_27875 [Planctomycetes bacterium]|nr:hypothetical protein [Planctomycetota bacterium]